MRTATFFVFPVCMHVLPHVMQRTFLATAAVNVGYFSFSSEKQLITVVNEYFIVLWIPLP